MRKSIFFPGIALLLALMLAIPSTVFAQDEEAPDTSWKVLLQHDRGWSGLWTLDDEGAPEEWDAVSGALDGWILRDIDGDQAMLQRGAGGPVGIWDLDRNGNPVLWTPVWGPIPGWIARSLDDGRIMCQEGETGAIGLLQLSDNGDTEPFGGLLPPLEGWRAVSMDGDDILFQYGPGGPIIIRRIDSNGSFYVSTFLVSRAIPGWTARSIAGDRILLQQGDGGRIGMWGLDDDKTPALWIPVSGPNAGWRGVALDRPNEPEPVDLSFQRVTAMSSYAFDGLEVYVSTEVINTGDRDVTDVKVVCDVSLQDLSLVQSDPVVIDWDDWDDWDPLPWIDPVVVNISKEETIDLLPAGETRTVTFVWLPADVLALENGEFMTALDATVTIDPDDEIEETDEDNNTTFELLLQMVIALKPNIYLYPEAETDVKVTLERESLILVSDPEYPDGGWEVSVSPDGTIDGQHGFLFYEAAVPNVFDTEEGWIVEASEVETWTSIMLPEMGLNEQETADFVEYWMEALPEAERYAFYPQWDEAVDEAVGLDISPAPDSVLRLWFVVKSLSDGETLTLASPEIPQFTRNGFTAVEWGVLLE